MIHSLFRSYGIRLNNCQTRPITLLLSSTRYVDDLKTFCCGRKISLAADKTIHAADKTIHATDKTIHTADKTIHAADKTIHAADIEIITLAGVSY